MFNWFLKIFKLERSRRLSIIFGVMMVVGLLFVTVGILASVKVTPYRTYTNKKLGVLIKFPAYWKPILDPAPGSIVAFVSPKSNELDLVQDNVNIAIKVLPRPMTAARLSDIIKNQVIGTFGERADVLESKAITFGGRPGYRFTFYGYDPKIPNPLLYVCAWTNIDANVYIFTFTGLKKDYPLFEKKINTMISSFKFIPIENP